MIFFSYSYISKFNFFWLLIFEKENYAIVEMLLKLMCFKIEFKQPHKNSLLSEIKFCEASKISL